MGICVSCRRRERKAPEKRSVPTAGGLAKGAAAELLPRRDRLPAPVMANSMSNIKMTNPIKNMVSKRRRRYTKDGFNLDLTYITDKLIAMGFPAEKLESVYRNPIDEVYRFLEKYHKDHYKIYNLCSEKRYDETKFHSRVVSYPFKDHTPPNLELIQPFCEDVHQWLNINEQNIAAVHCKAGKGRTGTMVCCYLLYSRQMATADEALKYYGTKRTHDEKGVTIPSQRRYVEYYAALLRSGLQYSAPKVHIRQLIMSPPPTLNGSHFSPELTVSQAHPSYKTPSNSIEVHRESDAVRVLLPFCTPLFGDVRVDVYNKPKMKMRKEKLFHFWFNTFFVAKELGAYRVQPLPESPNQEAFKLTLNKWQLDDAHKDKLHKLYSPDFKVELIILKVPETSKFTGPPESGVPLHSSSSSSCSEADTEPDGHWDSGEHLHIPYRRLAESRDRFYTDESPDEPTGRLFVVGDRDSPSDERASSPDSDGDRSPPPPLPTQPAGGRYCDRRHSPISPTQTTDSLYSNDGHMPPLPAQAADNHYCDRRHSPPTQLVDGDYSDGHHTPPPQAADVNYTDGDHSPPPPTPSVGNHNVDKTKHDSDDKKKLNFFHKNEEGLSRPRLSLGDMRASWREFSGKFASDNRKKKNKDDVS